MGVSAATPGLASPGRLAVWVMAARPATLPAAITPVLVGSALALKAGRFSVEAFVVALLCSILIQIGTNLANDYFDFRRGADTGERLGPVRVTSAGLVAPSTVRTAMIGTFAVAALLGLDLVRLGGWPILLIGLLSILSGVVYTGGPFPLAYNALGDVFVFVFFGLVAVLGTFYVHAGMVTGEAVAAALPVALLVTAILVVNNLRDIDTDRVAGKRTLAVVLGHGLTRVEFAACILGAYLYPLWRVLIAGGSLWSLLPLATLPLGLRLITAVRTQEGRALNLVLKQTGMLHLTYGLLLAAGILLG